MCKTSSGNNFESSKRIEIVKKKFSVFIQTDKSIYKPADKVQFRVLLLDADTRPFNASKVKIFITDGGDNRVKQFDNPKFVKGVYQNELQLSDLPVMGNWSIHVEVDAKKEGRKVFEVAEYVLPKFELSIEANPDANFKDGKIRATVKAKYTFGKAVKGNATITASQDKSYYYYLNEPKKVSKTVDIDGKKVVEFDIEKDLGIRDKYQEHTVNLCATFTEELSGKQQNATAKVQIHITPHKMELKKSGENFKPGFPFKVTAIVKHHDKDAPVTDSQNPVKFKIKTKLTMKSECLYNNHFYDYYFDSSENSCVTPKKYIEVKNVFLKSGTADLWLDPKSTAQNFYITVNLKFNINSFQIYLY